MSDANVTKFQWEIRQVKALERIADALEAANEIAMGHKPRQPITVQMTTHDTETQWANGEQRLLRPEAYDRLRAERSTR